MGVLAFVGQRLLQAIPTMLILIAVVFSMVRLTGDPARLYLGDFATPEAIETMRARWGLDRHVVVQFASYLGGIVRGDLGESLRYARPVSELVGERISASVQLAAAALLLAVIVAIPAGTIAALDRGGPLDTAIRFLIVLGQAIPRFYLGILLILIFGLFWRMLPTSGSGTFRHLILPAVTLSTPTMALLARLTRSAVLDVINLDYVRTARSKGLSPFSVVGKHVLRNALMAPLTVITIQFSQLIGGAVVVETVFGWPGLGQLAIASVYTRDFVLIQGIVLLLTGFVLLVSVFTDVLYGIVDPRITYG
jgi:peptide/nickel transport system permease protein